VRLQLWSVPADLYEIALFLMTAAIATIRWRGDGGQTSGLISIIFGAAVIGAAGVLWSLLQVEWRWHLLAHRYRVAGVAMIAILGISAMELNRPWMDVGRQFVRGVRKVLSSREPWFAGAALLAVFLLAQRRTGEMATDPSIPTGPEFLRWFVAQPVRNELRSGTANADVVVLKFNDYQCPACKRTAIACAPVIARLSAASAGRVRLQELDYPLETECNPFARADVHPAACEAAAAVRMARELRTEGAVTDWLWTNQSRLTPASVKEAARLVGRIPDYEARYEQVLKLIRDDVALGNKVAVAGTPTFFVNGKRLTVVRPSDFEAAIKSELGWDPTR
jgi:protein-disulfide isomerase